MENVSKRQQPDQRAYKTAEDICIRLVYFLQLIVGCFLFKAGEEQASSDILNILSRKMFEYRLFYNINVINLIDILRRMISNE